MALRQARFKLHVLSQLAPAGDHSGGAIGETTIDESYGSGTGDRQADAELYDVRSLAASGSETLNLQTILDANGVALGAAEVVDFVITADPANGDTLTIEPSAAEPWNDLLGAAGEHALKPGASLVLHSTQDGDYPITAGNRQIDVTNDDGAAGASYTLHVIVRRS
jgi:hypothetical protein